MKPIRKYPSGYKFAPTEQELLFYLRYKANHERNDDEEKVPLKFVDIHKVTDPGVLFKNTEEDSVYIFTEFRKVSQDGTGKRYDRTAGDYTWSGSDKAKAVEEGKTRLGWMRNFSFEKNKKKIGYSMKELTLDDSFCKDAKFKDYVVCIIRRKSRKEEEFEEENLQGGIEEDHPELAIPDGYIDDRGYYFPTPINSYNGFTDIVNYTEVQQCHETNETIIPSHDHVLPLLLSAEGYQNQYQETPCNIVDACQYQNQMNNQSTTTAAIVPFADQVYQQQYQQYQQNNELIASTSWLPSCEGNLYSQLDLIMELASAPGGLSFPDDYQMYSHSITPFPSDQLEPIGNIQSEINETISMEQSNSQSIAAAFPTNQSAEPIRYDQMETNEIIQMAPSTTEIFSIENAMEIEQQSIVMPPSPTKLSLNASGERCTEFVRNLADQLTSHNKGKTLDIIREDSMIDNQKALENLSEFFIGKPLLIQ
ncbi:hypothetical protein ACH5RR_029798 [Cinchona calisaya]|uniref:NAC domain-containing protein n=1 Tax=Cinchona calisaya TaxID=153742 RepID=A0ABD2YW04_9GENT